MIPDRYQQYISPEDIPVSRNQESERSTQFQFVRDWIHRSTPALPPDMAYGEAWMNHNKDDPEAQQLTAKCRSAPSWKLFQAMYEIAASPSVSSKGEENIWVAWVVSGGEAKIWGALESTYSIFDLLFRKQQILRETINDYDAIIRDVEENVLLIWFLLPIVIHQPLFFMGTDQSYSQYSARLSNTISMMHSQGQWYSLCQRHSNWVTSKHHFIFI